MYSKKEASELRQSFWTRFGQYMQPVLSAEGERVNWINYKTGERAIAFRMQADNKQAYIGIEITHKDEGIRLLYYEQFLQLKKIFESIAGEDWLWQSNHLNEEGRAMARIYRTKQGVSIFRQDDWPELISFFKPHIINLDAFWSQARYSFEALR